MAAANVKQIRMLASALTVYGSRATSISSMHRAVFIDRDGVICRNRTDHVKSWEEFTFLPGALAALAELSQANLRIVIVTNQAIINRRIRPESVVQEIHTRMVQAIERAGGRVDRVMYCPHRPEEDCGCRKPMPGLLLTAAEELSFDPSQSYLIGDAETDILAGQAAGCRCYLVLTGRGQQQLANCRRHGQTGFRVMPDLGAAVREIVSLESNGHLAPTGPGGQSL